MELRQYIQWMLSILMIIGTTALTACSDDNNSDDNGDNPGTEYTWEEPTTDQLAVRVTAELPAASFSQFPELSTGAALIKRLPQVTASFMTDTRLILVKGSDISSLNDEQVKQMAITLMYDGYVAIATPTEQQLDEFNDKVMKAISAIVTDSIDDVFVLTPEQAAASVEASLAGRMATRRANLHAYTRATSNNEVCGEMVIFGADDYFYQDPMDSDDEPTAYHYGLMADGAAQWINAMEAEKAEEKKQQEQQEAAGAQRRANGSQAINDLISASETFTHYGNINYTMPSKKSARKLKACQMTLRSWAVHNFTNKRDYYYISQNVVLAMGNSSGVDLFFARGYKEGDWGKATGFGKNDLLYGNYLTQYETSMNLKGKNGFIKGEAATPETANQVITESVNLTSSSSSSAGGNYSLSVKGGWMFGKGLTLMGGAGFGHTFGSTTGSSFAMGNSKSIKDLAVVKNTAGTKVKWTYTGKELQVTGEPYKWKHEIMPEILVNDANISNDACWSVENPSGQYTLEVESKPETGLLLVEKKSGSKTTYRAETPVETYSHELLQPNRYVQTWRMFVTIDEWYGGSYSRGVQAQLEEELKRNFPDIYCDMFTIYESSEKSVLTATAIIKNAKRVLDSHKDELPGIAEGVGVKQFTIYWRCDNSDIKLRNGYVVKVQ